ncbi:hypothetical protein HPP92_000573 [Vanilla planifolia]|uniref:Elongation Factor G domain-containing protein n=1 Tax=Vanilla planifolia TaxID=51239 RepID=A0A835VL12_VANPL|nr:hypothetical protein HPP92_000573 [Vanilla planifolia]
MGKKQESVEDVPCGNTVAMVERWTLINPSDEFSVSPVVRFAVSCKVASDLPKLVEGLKRLPKSDPMVVCTIEESGEHIIDGAGELHLEICLKDLVEDFMGGRDQSNQTGGVLPRDRAGEILQNGDEQVITKHNRLYMKAWPLEGGLIKAIDDGRVGPQDDPKSGQRSSLRSSGGTRTSPEDLVLWPRTTGPNMVVDMCKVQYLNEIKDSVVAGFSVVIEGEHAWDMLRGVR